METNAYWCSYLLFLGAHGGAVVFGHYAISRKATGSIPDGVIGIFH